MNPTVLAQSPLTAEQRPRRKFTVSEVEAMVEAGIIDEGERVELIDGELVPMSPKGSRHEGLKVALNQRWGRVRPESCWFAQETTFRLSVDTYLEPDFVVFASEIRMTKISGPSALLAVEIADSSLRYDQGRKAGLYARFGVRELWVIDAAAMTLRVYRSPSPDGYLEIADHAATERIVPRFAPAEFALALDDLEFEAFG